MRSSRQVDVVVVGAGPAGSMAAARLARVGAKTLLVDKRSQVGVPVRCAEAVGRLGLQKYVFPRPRWISAEIEEVRLYAPNGEYLQLSQEAQGLILDRSLFDGDLARGAVEAGAELILQTYASGLLMDRGCVQGVHLWGPGGSFSVGAKLVIAADGVESRLARWAGIDSTLALKDVEICAQYVISGLKLGSPRCEFYFGHQVAPGGYAWIFPKGENTANVGVGIAGIYAGKSSAKEYLEAFVERVAPRGSKIRFVAGCVPVSRPLKKAYAPGLVVVGDAARQSNPLHGGGIIPALEAGHLAGDVAAQALAEEDVSDNFLSRYQRAWNRSLGRSYTRYYRLKEAVSRLPDETLNATARALRSADPSRLTMFQVFMTALRNKPNLILDIRHLFLPRRDN
jgi:digeranylgeranylglycerophospholipid reductase